jgi:hypothetical protein
MFMDGMQGKIVISIYTTEFIPPARRGYRMILRWWWW